MSKIKFVVPSSEKIEEVFRMVTEARDEITRKQLERMLLRDNYMTSVECQEESYRKVLKRIEEQGYFELMGVCLRSHKPSENINILHVIARGDADHQVLQVIAPYLTTEMYNDIDEAGSTPLMVAINSECLETFNVLLRIQHEKLKFLEFSTADIRKEIKHTVNIANNKFQTPLHIAVIKNNVEQIKTLLKLGANPWARDNEGNTPAHLAAKNPFTYKEALKMLAAVFGDPGLKNIQGKTVLDIVHENSSFESMQESDSKDYNDKCDGTWVNAKLNIVRKNSRFEPVQASGSKNHDNKKAEIFLDSSIQEIMKAFKKPNSFQEKFMHVGNRMSFKGL